MFLKDITITHLRGIKDFTLTNLPQIVLLGGRNNCGKTTFLEAVDFLVDQRSVRGFLALNRLRGLSISPMEAPLRAFTEEGLTKIFEISGTGENDLELQTHGATRPRKSYNISTARPTPPRVVTRTEDEAPSPETIEKGSGLLVHEPDPFGALLPGEAPNPEELVVTFQRTPAGGQVTYTRESIATPVDNIPEGWNIVEKPWKSSKAAPVPEEMKRFWGSTYIAASGMEVVNDRILELLFKQGEDERLIQVLKHIDPRIVRLSHVQNETLVTIKGRKHPLPLPALGMGSLQIIRILSCATLSMDGIMAIDEIENGLHHSSCHILWKTLLGLAKRNNIQLFITTHREDVLSSFAKAYEEMEDAPSAAYFNLIRDPETDELKAYHYTPKQLSGSMEAGFEVR